ncbi:MAG: hypothetical protein V4539_16785 [Bacteroidota bacterium]
MDRKVAIGIAVYAIAMTAVAFIAKGTGDEGDSISHYLFAKTAWHYKIHFFDHWAKPVYVLVAFPFAQFGFIGVKMMNVLLNCGSIWFTYRIACELKFKWAWIPAVLLASTPMFNHLSLSGLTEPMGACFLMAGLYLLIKEKWIAGVVFLSFLPFIRSEGLLMLGVVFVYLVIISKYRYLPLLCTGHIVYGILGSFYYKDVFWVLNKMTYATLGSPYGHGGWLHFIESLPEITGTALTVIFLIGILYGFILLIRYFRKQTTPTETPELFLIYGSLVFYFVAHSAFWALGIFNSGGILRVMITVMPLMALVNYRGLTYLFEFLNNETLKRKLVFVFTALLFLYPFSGHLFAYRWNRDFVPKADQYAELELGSWLKATYPDYHNHTFYYETVYLSEILDIDWFDSNKRERLLDSFIRDKFKSGDFLIWDDWFAVVEGHITLESLEKDQRLEKLKTFQRVNYWGGTRTTVVFRWK